MRFVKDFITIVAPFTEVIKNSVGFTWSQVQEEALQLLKGNLTNSLLLVLHVFL